MKDKLLRFLNENTYGNASLLSSPVTDPVLCLVVSLLFLYEYLVQYVETNSVNFVVLSK